MKAGDLFMVQWCAEHGSYRVMPLRSCVALARQDMASGKAHGWVVAAYAANEGDAYAKMKEFKSEQRERTEDAGDESE